jgi:uncharacterized heparinase superfamily protein
MATKLGCTRWKRYIINRGHPRQSATHHYTSTRTTARHQSTIRGLADQAKRMTTARYVTIQIKYRRRTKKFVGRSNYIMAILKVAINVFIKYNHMLYIFCRITKTLKNIVKTILNTKDCKQLMDWWCTFYGIFVYEFAYQTTHFSHKESICTNKFIQ